MLVQLFFIYYGFPKIGLQLDAEVCGAIGLAFLGGSYMAETFRSGLETIEPIQRESAVSLGLSNRQTMQYVILPQAMSVSVPAFVANVIFFVEGDECVQCHQFDGFDVYSQRFNWSVLQNNRESVFARRLLPDHSASSVNSGQSVGKRGCAMPDLGL